MDGCQVWHCAEPAAVILPTITDDVALCIGHAHGVLEVSDLVIPRQRPTDIGTVAS